MYARVRTCVCVCVCVCESCSWVEGRAMYARVRTCVYVCVHARVRARVCVLKLFVGGRSCNVRARAYVRTCVCVCVFQKSGIARLEI